MQENELKILIDEIRNGRNEDTATEWKAKWWDFEVFEGKQEFIRDITALANSITNDRKVLIIGVTKRGNVINAPFIGDEASLQEILKSITPIPNVKLQVFNLDGKIVSVLNIDPPYNKPYVAKRNKDNVVFIRYGSSIGTASRQTLDHFYLEKDRMPELEVLWHSFEDEVLDGHSEEVLNLKCRRISSEDLIEQYEKEKESIQEVDGSADPSWEEKATEFIDDCNHFIDAIKDPNTFRDWYIASNFGISTTATICVCNNGESRANNIQVYVRIPDWLLLMREKPEQEKQIHVPWRPTPTPPPKPPTTFDKMLEVAETLGRVRAAMIAAPVNNFLQGPKINFDTFEDGIEDNGDLSFWSKSLIHKHCQHGKSRFFFLALPNAPVGLADLEVAIFCEEMMDWRTGIIRINITTIE